MAKTESIEGLLDPSLRVSRPVAACARCRSAKIKCDGKLPACSACERAGKGSECSSANDDFAKGKERSYVAALETAIQRLEKRINEARSKTDIQHTTHNTSMTGLLGERPSPQRRMISGSRRREANDVDELVSDFGFLTVNATSRDFHGFTSTMSFALLLMAAASKKQLPAAKDLSIPSKYTITPLISHYFNNIYPILPFFSETDFMSSQSKVYQENLPAHSVAPSDHWNVRLVLAISAASTCQVKGDDKYKMAMQHMAAAMRLIKDVIQPGSTAGIQALLLLVQYALVDPEHFDSFYLIGMASRLVVDLGLHCEPAAEAKLSKHALDLRRRVFYCTYALDRYISMAQEHPFSFTDDSAPNVGLPTLATDLEKRSPSQLFLRSVRPSLFLFDLRRMQSGFWQTTRYSSRRVWPSTEASEYINLKLNEVRSWYQSIPSDFSRAHLEYFYLEFLYTQLLVVSPRTNYPVAQMTDTHKAMVFHFAAQYAQKMAMQLSDLKSQAFLTYQDVCRAEFAGQQFQEVIWSDFDKLLRYQHKLVPEPQNGQIAPADNCTRAINLITNVINILDFARNRWGISDMHLRFEQKSAVLLTQLQNKHQEFSKEVFQPGTISYTTQQPGHMSFTNNNTSSYQYDQAMLGPMSIPHHNGQMQAEPNPNANRNVHPQISYRNSWTPELPQPQSSNNAASLFPQQPIHSPMSYQSPSGSSPAPFQQRPGNSPGPFQR